MRGSTSRRCLVPAGCNYEHAISDDQWQSVAISETLGELLEMHLR
jgi:hypothetical protein